MNFAALIGQFRIDADDLVPTYLWRDEWIKAWLNEAVTEAAIRSRLLYEASDPALCEIPVAAGVAAYPTNRIYELCMVRLFSGASRPAELRVQTRGELDRICPGWRDRPAGTPRYLILDERSMVLVPAPAVAGTLKIEGFRTPLRDMVAGTDEPEIRPENHDKLVHWALYRAFSKPDAESHDPKRAEREEARFIKVFGRRPNADLRRSTREDQPQTNKPFWV